jgi:hypothetical protein
MNRPAAVLLATAIAFPIGSFLLLRLTSGPFGIPHRTHLVFFTYILPALGVAAAVGSKLAGARLARAGVAVFAVWLAVVGWLHHRFITGLWDSI